MERGGGDGGRKEVCVCGGGGGGGGTPRPLFSPSLLIVCPASARQVLRQGLADANYPIPGAVKPREKKTLNVFTREDTPEMERRMEKGGGGGGGGGGMVERGNTPTPCPRHRPRSAPRWPRAWRAWRVCVYVCVSTVSLKKLGFHIHMRGRGPLLGLVPVQRWIWVVLSSPGTMAHTHTHTHTHTCTYTCTSCGTRAAQQQQEQQRARAGRVCAKRKGKKEGGTGNHHEPQPSEVLLDRRAGRVSPQPCSKSLPGKGRTDKAQESSSSGLFPILCGRAGAGTQRGVWVCFSVDDRSRLGGPRRENAFTRGGATRAPAPVLASTHAHPVRPVGAQASCSQQGGDKKRSGGGRGKGQDRGKGNEQKTPAAPAASGCSL